MASNDLMYLFVEWFVDSHKQSMALTCSRKRIPSILWQILFNFAFGKVEVEVVLVFRNNRSLQLASELELVSCSRKQVRVALTGSSTDQVQYRTCQTNKLEPQGPRRMA